MKTLLSWLRKHSIHGFITFLLLSFLLTLTAAVFYDTEQVLVSFSLVDPDQKQTLQIMIAEQNEGEQLLHPLSEFIINGDFTQGLAGWDYWGEVELIQADQNHYLKIGTETSSNLVQENCIQQTVDFYHPPLFLSFDIRQFSQDGLPGFEAAGLVILIDQTPIFILSTELTDDWISVVMRVPILNPGQHDLTICVGNSGDRESASWLYLDNLSTRAAAVNQLSQIKLTALREDYLIQAEYEDSSGTVIQQENHQLDLSFSDEVINNQLNLSLFNNSDNLLRTETMQVFWFEDELAVPQVLTAAAAEEHKFLISFNNADYLPNYWFKVWAAASFDLFENGQDLCPAKVIFPDLTLDLLRPNCLLDDCLILADLSACSIDQPWIAVQVCDPSFNCSAFSEPIQVQDLIPTPTSGPTPTITPLPSPTPATPAESTPTPTSHPSQAIQINEIMFNPLGDDRGENLEGEWIELYNSTNTDLDLVNWRMEDEVGHQIILSNHNSCNDINQIEQGSTVIPAQAYLVVFVHGSPILRNSGDDVALYDDEGTMIDHISYPGSTVEDKTYGRIPDGSDKWQRWLPPTPLAPNQTD